MRSLILAALFCLAMCHASGQILGASNISGTCDAAFTANPDPFNPMVFHFQDRSSGQITLWQWNFGDGSTATNRDPVHAYASGGTFYVCLTVSSSDSVNICHDVFCFAVTVHEPGACVADYRYNYDPANRLKVNFADQSGGNITGWHWDFGDGNSSYERNPIHIFPAEGKFRVCLTAYNVDSVSTCNDVKCDTVEINPQEDCHALFTAELDTLNPAPNTFFFRNNSTGDADRFLWTFDDGATYDTRNVVHRFQTDGPHEACLAIKKEVHGEIVCSDTLCQTVTTAKYYNIGGHLFAGAFPINNPVSTGDTGVAYLYRIDAGKLIPCGISKFVQYGYYTFPKMLSGSYLIKAALTPWSVHYSKYFPSYYHKTLFWKEANFLNLADSNAYVSDIHLLPVNDSLSGPGVLAGTVQKAYSKNSVEEMPFTQIILYDGQLTPVRFTVSGKSGQFEFDNLPYGTYYLYVEYPGKYSRLTTVWLDSATPVISNLQLEVFNHDVTSVPDVTLITVVAGDLFPNPAINEVNLNIDLAADITVKFDVRTLTGLSVWSGTRKCMAGSNLITIPVASLKSGLYLLKIIGSDGSPITVKKLVKY